MREFRLKLMSSAPIHLHPCHTPALPNVGLLRLTETANSTLAAGSGGGGGASWEVEEEGRGRGGRGGGGKGGETAVLVEAWREPAPLPPSRRASRPGPILATRPRGIPLSGALASFVVTCVRLAVA